MELWPLIQEAAKKKMQPLFTKMYEDFKRRLDEGEDISRAEAHAYVAGMCDILEIGTDDSYRIMLHSTINELFDFYHTK